MKTADLNQFIFPISKWLRENDPSEAILISSTGAQFLQVKESVICREFSASDTRSLRERTGAGLNECHQALVDAGGHVEVAFLNLTRRGA